MKTDARPIAKTELVRVRASGERVSIVAEIGQAYQTADGFWRTPVALQGLDGRLCDICGEDSLQSLSLAVEMVHAVWHPSLRMASSCLIPRAASFHCRRILRAHMMIDPQMPNHAANGRE